MGDDVVFPTAVAQEGGAAQRRTQPDQTGDLMSRSASASRRFTSKQTRTSEASFEGEKECRVKEKRGVKGGEVGSRNGLGWLPTQTVTTRGRFMALVLQRFNSPSGARTDNQSWDQRPANASYGSCGFESEHV